MTPQEKQVLTDFLNQLVQVRGITKDPEAQAYIDAALARQPDAAYLLVQRTLLEQQALEAAKAEIGELRSQLQAQQPGTGASFLGGGNEWGRSAVRHSVSNVSPSAPGTYYNPAYEPVSARARSGFLGGAGGSFLGSAAATAAGVLGGAFLFQGIEHMLGQHHAASAAGQQGLLDSTTGNEVDAGDQFQDLSSDGVDDLASSAGLDDIGLDDAGYDDASPI